MIGEDKLIHFSGVEMGAACTIVLRGASTAHTASLLSTSWVIYTSRLRDVHIKRGPLRLAGIHVLDEAERSLHDALCVLSQTVKDSRVVYGGGWPEMQMAGVVQRQAARTPGKRSLAMEAFARALRAIPATICDNAGGTRLDPAPERRLT